MIELRSDTFTQPTAAMRDAIAAAPVGDDMFDEDPTVNRLQEVVAERLGKEAAIFVPSGTMSNQIGVRLHCDPGDEFIGEADCHILHYEQAAYAQLFGIAAVPIAGDGGLLTPEMLEGRVRGEDIHAPRTRLVCLENTHNRLGGRVLPHGGVARLCAAAAEHGLARHLDGARLWNAAVETGVPPADWAVHFDTVSVCFSKGLGAPIGSALSGTRAMIDRARRLRKALGGAMRQAGLVAAAALHALEHHFDRLVDDHRNARVLAEAVRQSPHLTLVADRCDTNIVIFNVDPRAGTAADFCERLEKRGVLSFDIGPRRVRFVTHLGVSQEQAELASEALRETATLAAEQAAGP